MNVYGYARVSTARQAKYGLSLDEQQRRINGRALEEDWTVTKTFVEGGITAAIPFAQRPQGAALLAGLRPGDAIIVAKLDRAFRDCADALAIVRDLERRRVTLYLLDLGGNVSRPGIPRMLVTIFAAIAEFERHRIAERIAEGKIQQRLNNTFLGGHRPFGFQIGEDGKTLIADAGEQAALDAIFRASAQGISMRAIAALLNAQGVRLSKSAVANLLNRPRQQRI
jgi:putative DNA-invertase from lambdoid prophage Rac